VIEVSKATLGSNAEEKAMTKLEIVWRNPKPVRHHSRRHNRQRESERTLYILQEFVADGYVGHWATVSALEMLAGGPAA
jgi:hypothetical protein